MKCLIMCGISSGILTVSGADSGFLEKGFMFIKLWGVLFADFISFFLNIP